MTLSAVPLAACTTYYAAPLTSTSGASCRGEIEAAAADLFGGRPKDRYVVLTDDEALVQVTSLPGKRSRRAVILSRDGACYLDRDRRRRGPVASIFVFADWHEARLLPHCACNADAGTAGGLSR
jgi:hypothetical protein